MFAGLVSADYTRSLGRRELALREEGRREGRGRGGGEEESFSEGRRRGGGSDNTCYTLPITGRLEWRSGGEGEERGRGGEEGMK